MWSTSAMRWRVSEAAGRQCVLLGVGASVCC